MFGSACPTDMSRLVVALAESARTEEYMLFVEYSAVLNGCLELLSAFSGMERENITRGPGWLFLSLGRRLERAMYSVRQLRELTAGLDEESWPLLEYLLEVADSSMTYRSRYFTTLQPMAVLDVLMADETNPRSLEFSDGPSGGPAPEAAAPFDGGSGGHPAGTGAAARSGSGEAGFSAARQRLDRRIAPTDQSQLDRCSGLGPKAAAFLGG